MSDDDPDADEAGEPPPLDVVVGVGVTADREGVRVVRLRDAAPDETHAEPHRVIEVGEMRAIVPDHALPIGSELVRLRPRDDGPAWNVEVVVPRQRALAGPPQVATATYRANWSATFDDDAN